MTEQNSTGGMKQGGQGQSQSMGSMSQSQSQGSGGQGATGPSGHEIPDAQAGYGNSQDESGTSEQGAAGKDSADKDKRGKPSETDTAAEAALAGKAVPGEISPRPDEQARADANPQLYDG